MLFVLGSTWAFGQFWAFGQLVTLFDTPQAILELFSTAAVRITDISIEDHSVGVLPLLISYVFMIPLLAFVSDRGLSLPDLV